MLNVGMSDCGEKNKNYIAYVLRMPDVRVTVLSKKNIEKIEECDGLLLTGGADVSPELYGDWADETVEIDSERDGVEFRLIEEALLKKAPILGICRGLQVLNVYFGGTLVLDLEKYYGRNHRAISDVEDRYHDVELTESSSLMNFIKTKRGKVSSSHHQAADRIGNGLKVVARALDGTVEAIEGTATATEKILAVQWHPERMRHDDPFASGALDVFKLKLSGNNKENTLNGG